MTEIIPSNEIKMSQEIVWRTKNGQKKLTDMETDHLIRAGFTCIKRSYRCANDQAEIQEKIDKLTEEIQPVLDRISKLEALKDTKQAAVSDALLMTEHIEEELRTRGVKLDDEYKEHYEHNSDTGSTDILQKS